MSETNPRPFFANNQRGRGANRRRGGIRTNRSSSRGDDMRDVSGRGRGGGRGRGRERRSEHSANTNDINHFPDVQPNNNPGRCRSNDSSRSCHSKVDNQMNSGLLDEITGIIVNGFNSIRTEVKSDITEAFKSIGEIEKNQGWKKSFYKSRSKVEMLEKELKEVKQNQGGNASTAELSQKNKELYSQVEKAHEKLSDYESKRNLASVKEAALEDGNKKLQKRVEELIKENEELKLKIVQLQLECEKNDKEVMSPIDKSSNESFVKVKINLEGATEKAESILPEEFISISDEALNEQFLAVETILKKVKSEKEAVDKIMELKISPVDYEKLVNFIFDTAIENPDSIDFIVATSKLFFSKQKYLIELRGIIVKRCERELEALEFIEHGKDYPALYIIITVITELHRVDLLSFFVIVKFIKQMLKNTSEYNLKCICHLINRIYRNVDKKQKELLITHLESVIQNFSAKDTEFLSSVTELRSLIKNYLDENQGEEELKCPTE